jgi:putative transposase
LLQRKHYKFFGKYISKFSLIKHITKLKKQKRFSAWNKIGSQAVQDVCSRIDKSYRRFFDSLKKKNSRKARPPKLKKLHHFKSITLTHQAGFKLIGNGKIKIGKTVFRYHDSRQIEGRIKTLTISRSKTGDLFLCFACEVELPQTITSCNSAVGLDFGLKTFATLSDGTTIEHPQFHKRALRKLKTFNRSLSRKAKGSVRWRRARKRLARFHEKIANQRDDWAKKTANSLVKKYDCLFLEDLNLSGMQALWGRKMSDVAFGRFVSCLEWMAKKRGSIVHKIDRFFPSSKVCSCCGRENQGLRLRDREWECNACESKHDRDLNAARNILKVGTSTFAGVTVRPAA